MPTNTAPLDGDNDLHEILDDLLTDFGAFIGEPDHRNRIVKGLIKTAGVNEADAKTLRWYFQHVETDDKLRSMGGFVAAKLKNATIAKDTLKGARKLRNRLEKKVKKDTGGENQHYKGGNEEERKWTLEDWETGIYYWHHYDSPSASAKGKKGEKAKIAQTATHFEISEDRVRAILLAREDRAMPEDS